ncbi:acyclic terpene utilization AtuA family protein [Streptacidiphilus fuscans]|uniref:Acyclic terpene utilization AtuA family protein n=1 Tax=Streptacidiphilus fuscans TaxID=2789292 RepID=A0A931B266_9ACTN|nr:acyclic terpene utilization AtuA family protein [Streptacidiphilus fuscans]MBF9066638.1 acyclic terpene utilization AtuA family protein [Streptacidiphilus fuscans]
MEIRILAPTGALGAGFPAASLERGVAMKPHVIACDAGSTDSGPFYLGTGEPKLSRAAVRRDLKLLLKARDTLNVPLIIGSCGTSGRDEGVDLVAELAREIAAEENLSFKLALIYSGQDPVSLAERYAAGDIRPLDPAPSIDLETVTGSHVVAMMGVEPIERAVTEGADVILAGRASDTALFAALPHLLGADPGLTWHMAKTVECGAACAIPPGADGLLVRLRDDHFDVEPLNPATRLTPHSVAAHTLYENAHPHRVVEPSGVLDTTRASYTALDDRTVRVTGAEYHEADTYTIKLEGARLVGHQTIAVGGIRDRVVIKHLPKLLPMAQDFFRAKILDVFGGEVNPDDVDIDYRLYGQDAVLGPLDPQRFDEVHELGVLITVTAPTQEIAHAVSTFVAHISSHLPIPGYDGLASTIAYPFSPPETDRGPVYQFTLNHVAVPADPFEMFRTVHQEVAP